MGFQQGLSGLNAASKNLDVIGNNIANSNTVGFKSSQAQFADVFANSLIGAGGSQVGIGVSVGAVMQQFNQGNLTVTNNPLDVAINGNGFFRMADNNGSLSYTRNGQFHLDKNGYIVNDNGLNLTGYPYDPVSKAILSSTPTKLQLSSAELQPNPTTLATMGLNLDATSPVINRTVTAFNPLNAATYTSATAYTAYDSYGMAHQVSVYFTRTNPPSPATWEVQQTLDGKYWNGTTYLDPTVTPPTLGAPAVSIGNLVFKNDGTLDQAASTTNGILAAPPYTPGNGAANMAINLDFTQSTQFGSPFGVNALSQNGYAAGTLSGFNISDKGVVIGAYTNGQTNTLGQIALANFTNPQGLQPMGNNQWAETGNSGQPMVGTPGNSNLGVVQAAAVESSNVDLTAELVNLITAQRVYQANAQTIQAQSTVLNTIVNIR